jgi:hypothetical protein
MNVPQLVIPAKAGTQHKQERRFATLFSQVWASAYAGVTEIGNV